MNILDENILESQRQLLLKWHVPFRQIGCEAGRKGMDDKQIISFLLTLPRPTFFTQDQDYYQQGLCHAKYCLVVIDVKSAECAAFIRRVLQHPAFNTQTKRMGNVIRASYRRLVVWRLHADKEEYFDWVDRW